MKGQISIEMILILAAVLAIVFILATQLQSVTNKASDAVDQKTNQILDLTNVSGNDTDKEFCLTHDDCPGELLCVNNYCE